MLAATGPKALTKWGRPSRFKRMKSTPQSGDAKPDATAIASEIPWHPNEASMKTASAHAKQTQSLKDAACTDRSKARWEALEENRQVALLRCD